MIKWNKDTFVVSSKKECNPRISNIIVDLVNFTATEADIISWGRGKGYGTMTFKCKSEERAGLRSGGISELDGFDTIVKSIPFDTAFYCAIQNVFEDSKLRKYNFTFLGILMEYNIFKNALERNKGKTAQLMNFE